MDIGNVNNLHSLYKLLSSLSFGQHFINMLLRFLQMQSSFQQKQERDRKDLEQAHMKIVKQLESRLYELEGSNKVGISDQNWHKMNWLFLCVKNNSILTILNIGCGRVK